MKQPFPLRLLVVTAFALTIFACTKTGPMGAKGATGANGAQGPKGDSGAPGAKGDTGVANVKYSPWISFNWNVSGNNSATSPVIKAASITSQILDSGFVLVYIRADSSSPAYSLPYTQLVNG